MIVSSRDYVTTKYKLHKLKEIEDLVASNVEIVRQKPPFMTVRVKSNNETRTSRSTTP